MRTGQAVLGALVLTLCAAGVIGLAATAHHGRAVAVILAALTCAGASRAWMLGVWPTDAGVKVVGFVTTHNFAWDDIDRFE